jgi:hypothetical protein
VIVEVQKYVKFLSHFHCFTVVHKLHYQINPFLWLGNFWDEFMLHHVLKGSNSH